LKGGSCKKKGEDDSKKDCFGGKGGPPENLPSDKVTRKEGGGEGGGERRTSEPWGGRKVPRSSFRGQKRASRIEGPPVRGGEKGGGWTCNGEKRRCPSQNQLNPEERSR